VNRLPSTPSPPWRGGERIAVLLAWLLPALLFAWVAGATQGTYDTFRDLWVAVGIVEGLEWPAVGPGIYQTFHLGPLWFYLLAALVLVLPPATAAAMLTALVLAARFPLAYAAGRAIAGPRAGLWALALMAVPGWWVLALGVVTHTAATEAAVLWLVVATLAAMRRPNAGRQLWLGLAAAVAVHAHPTTVAPAAVAAWLALSSTPSGQRPRALAWLALPGLVLVAPYLLGGGFAGDLAAIGRYAGTLRAPPSAARMLALPPAVLLAGPFHAVWIWGGLEPVPAALLGPAPWLLAAGAALWGARTLPGRGLRRTSALFALGFLGQCLLLALLRPVTPPWMVFGLVPLAVLALAPLAAQVPARRARWLLPATVAAFGIAGSAATLAGLTAPARGGSAWWPVYPAGSPGPMSVSEFPIGRQAAGPPLAPLSAYDALLPSDCDAVQLHGELALLADRSLGYAWRRACGGSTHAALGGGAQPGARQRFALWHPGVLAYCGIARAAMVPGTATVLDAGPPLPLGDAARYPARAPVPAPEAHRLSLASTEPLLFVGTVLPASGALELLHASANGGAARRIAETPAFVVLACGDCMDHAPVAWDLDLHAVPGTLDLVGFSCPAAP